MDFFEQANSHITELNENEHKIFEYVVRSIHDVQKMQIRVLAANCFVSTTTIVRFVKKLGFGGYREFIESICITCHAMENTQLPEVLWRRSYSEEYLKNIIETIRVITQEKIDGFRRCLLSASAVYFFGAGLDREPARYAYRLFTSMGYRTFFLSEDYEMQSAIGQMHDNDILFLFCLEGEDKEVIRLVESARMRSSPVAVTVTNSANNLLQSLSDLDFYVFTDRVRYKNFDLSARVSMIAIAELLAYSLMSAGE